MVASIHTSPIAVSDRAIRALAGHVRGSVIQPGDAAYEQARRVWNAAVDRYPALIVRPRDAHDVRHTVAFARANDLPLAVRGGGHGVAGDGTVDGGVVVDLSPLKQFSLDRERREAWAETGLTWGEFNALAYADCLATPGPDVTAVGLGGLTLGGGFGILSRKFGMTIDNLLAAEVVTADGQLVTASGDEHPDLFWALRGGGGNFGIATRLRFQMHPVADVVGGVLIYPATRGSSGTTPPCPPPRRTS
jgi:FAD/FMN-containing dehydrogenase